MKNMIFENEPFEITKKLDNVDYGCLEKVTYFSKTANRITNVNILLPVGYSEDKKYPVLYVLHGYWGNEDSIPYDEANKITEIIGNLINNGEAKEMITVFPYIYTNNTQPKATALDLENSLNYDNFINDLLTDLMPFIEDKYPIKTGKENTAITGFSMGGRESLFIGFSRSDIFGYIGAVCPAPGLTPGIDLNLHPGQLKESELVFKNSDKAPYLVMISAAKNDEVVENYPEKYHNILTNNGVKHIWHPITNGDHGGCSVRAHMYYFVKEIFMHNLY